jgi:hypothetical protein
MAAYQCLNCKEIDHGIDDCCKNPDLFCINDMPGEIVRLRAELAAEREHCAKIVDGLVRRQGTVGRQLAVQECAAVIRKS